MRLTPGTVLARRYCLGELVGEGGMGEVWAARHLVTGKAVAVKRLICAAHERGFGEARARFALEAKSACAVEHPNVVEVYDFIESDDEGPFIVMELLQGETLAARLTRGALGSPREVAELMLPVVSAVGTAHERGIIHRDLKPSNIFISARPGEPTRDKIKVLDFGIAKWLAGSRDERGLSTRTGSALGTPSYMAPEQATAERSADHRVDIWSLGVILYEVTSGVRPLEGENAAQLVMRLLSSGIMPIEQLVPELPEALAALIGRMLTRDVARRPRDLREVYAVLRELAGVDSLSFGPPRVAEVAARNVGAAGEAKASGTGSSVVDPNGAVSASVAPLPPTRRQPASEVGTSNGPQPPSARAVTPTRTSVDALAVTARAGVAVTVPEDRRESWEEAAQQTHAAFSTDELWAGAEARERHLARASRRRRLTGLAALMAAAVGLAGYALERTSATPQTESLQASTTSLAARPSSGVTQGAHDAPIVHEPTRDVTTAASAAALEDPEPGAKGDAPHPPPGGVAGGTHAARQPRGVDAWALDGWALQARERHARGVDARGGNTAASIASRGSKHASATKLRSSQRNATSAPSSSPGGTPATAGDALRAEGESAPPKKPKGVECESSPECRSNLCVAYTCQ